MTNTQTSLSDQGRRCRICTGCGRCAGAIPDIRIVTDAPQSSGIPGGFGLPGEALGEGLMIAADIGTTTIAMQLREMADGRVLDTYRAVNPQRKYGADVVSRIQEAEDPQGEAAQEMRRMVRGILEEGIASFRAPGREIKGMVIAANTAMIYLLMGYSISGLGRVPFTAEHLEEITTVIGGVQTIIMPGISAFVGADILAGMYAVGMGTDGSKEADLLIDLGTNGEMALGNGERILTTATAAGPAFEGRMGVGVWGADAVKFLEALLKQGLMDETGLLADAYFEEGVPIGGITMTQADIRSLQLAKAAICAGVRILCGQYGLQDMKGQIRNVYLAGGFGYYLDPAAAAAVGLIPKELADKCRAVGNSALEGAFCYGRGRLAGDAKTAAEAQSRILALKGKAESINLAESPAFFDQYIEAMNF